jgi:hypothetical protein
VFLRVHNLLTSGDGKPVLNPFRMPGQMAGDLGELEAAREATIGRDGRVAAGFDLPRKSVSFIKVDWQA